MNIFPCSNLKNETNNLWASARQVQKSDQTMIKNQDFQVFQNFDFEIESEISGSFQNRFSRVSLRRLTLSALKMVRYS